jgi:hypothetical protein
MGNCGDCRWWDGPHDTPHDWGSCELAESNGNEGLLHPDTLAQATDTENYAAALLTRRDFGCVQWQERETE